MGWYKHSKDPFHEYVKSATVGASGETKMIEPSYEETRALRNDQSRKRKQPHIDPVEPDSKRAKPVGTMSTDIVMVESKAESSSAGANAANMTTMPIYHAPVMGFPETWTCICPVDIYLAYQDLEHAATALNKLEIRMNSPYTPIIAPTALVAQSANAAKETGFVREISADGVNSSGTLVSFPIPLGGSGTTLTNPTPAWRSYYEKIYDVYHVLETNWSMEVMAANSTATHAATVLWEYDTYGASTTGNQMPEASLGAMEQYQGIHRHIVKNLNANQGNDYVKFGDTWNPGKTKTNVFNEEDMKIWSAVGAVPSPTYVESLHMRFFRAPLSEGANNVVKGSVNIHLRVNYVVQFKDKKVQFRYPTGGQDVVALNWPTDVLQS
jgi:hypothetical protein